MRSLGHFGRAPLPPEPQPEEILKVRVEAERMDERQPDLVMDPATALDLG